MKVERFVRWLRIPRNLVITTSAGIITVLAAVVFVHYPRSDSSWVKVKSHTFRHAVIDDGINSMNCMSGPWNQCVVGRKLKNGHPNKATN
jgi:hypothetical protein